MRCVGLRSGKRSLRVGMSIAGSSGDVGPHWCGSLSPLMLKRDELYRDLGPDWHVRRDAQAHTRRLVTQLDRLGHTVPLKAPPAA